MVSKILSCILLVVFLFGTPTGGVAGRLNTSGFPSSISAPQTPPPSPQISTETPQTPPTFEIPSPTSDLLRTYEQMPPLDPASLYNQSQMPGLASGEIAPATADTAIIFCPGTGTGDGDVTQRGLRFTTSTAFRGIEVRLAAFPVGDFVIWAELRRGTGFTTTPIATTGIFVPVKNVNGNHPYLPYAFNFGAISVSGTETFTVKLIVKQGPGAIYIETFGASTPCAGVSLTADVTGSNPGVVGDPAGFKLLDFVYSPPFGVPDVDGVIGYGEWDQYSAINFPGGFVAMQRDTSRLYFLIDVTGDTYNNTAYDEDYFYLSFDADGDSAITPYRDINFTIDANGNMRRQHYLGEADWGDFFGTNSSRAKAFQCESEDGTYYLESYFPLRWNCTKHRIWEVAIDLNDIEAYAGRTVHMGFMVVSANPGIIERHPEDFAVDFSDYYVIRLDYFPLKHNDATGVWVNNPQALEVTQAIQNLDNTLPLVQGKDTVVRAYGSAWYVQERQLLYAYLYGTRNGVDLPGSPLREIFNAPVESIWYRDKLDDTANFLLPESWTSGTIELRLYMTTTEFSSGDSSYDPLTVTFQQRKIPNYWYIPINQGSVANPKLAPDETIYAYRGFLESVYPVADVDWTYRSWEGIGVITDDSYLMQAVKIYSVQVILAYNQTIAEGNPPPYTFPDQVFAISPNNVGGQSDPVWFGGAGLAAYGGESISGTGVMAHEIDHNLDRSKTGTWGRHTPFGCGAAGPDPDWPYTTAEIQEVGFDTRYPNGDDNNETVLHEFYPDLMSYCKEAGTPVTWISPYRWTKLFEFFKPATSSTQMEKLTSFEQVYYVSGQLKPDGSGSLLPALIASGVADTPIEDGVGAIEIRDAANTLLYTHTFPVEYDPQPDVVAPTLEFFFMLPLQPGANKIILKYNDTQVDEIIFSDHAPTVTLLSPNGGESWGEAEQTVTWSAQDEDDDPLTFILQYSPDNGVSWFPAGINLTGSSAVVNPAQWKAGEQALLRILASDGVNTAMDTSDLVFSVSEKPPLVQIIKPVPEYWVLPGEEITLSGAAQDLEEETLSDENFIWMLGDEVLGTGRELAAILPPGVHTIRLYVSDTDDNVGWAETQVTVAYRVYVPVVKK